MAKLKSMKKWISMALAMIMVVAMFTGCASPEKIETKETKETTEATETPNTSVSEEAVEAGKSQPAQRIVSGYYILRHLPVLPWDLRTRWWESKPKPIKGRYTNWRRRS